MDKSVSTSDAKSLVALFDKFQSSEAKEAFSYVLLSFSQLPNCYCEPESHGYASSLRIMDGADWSYSFSPAQHWVLGYVRPPEMSKERITLADLQRVLPHAVDRGDNHLKVRLHNISEAKAFFETIEMSRH